MQGIEREAYAPALGLFRNSRHQMKLAALAEGLIEAKVFTDGAEPTAAAVLYQNKLMIASALDTQSLAMKIEPLLEQVYGQRMGGAEEVLIFWDGEHARNALLQVIGNRCPAYTLREYWELDGPANAIAAAAPDGYEIRPVDAALLELGLVHTDRLREEMCSERVSVQEFLGQSFGVCAVQGGELAGWCMSEYNCSLGCEVGIEVVEGHRRKGLAHAMVSAFAEEAARRGAPRIGWHCFESNRASSSTARSAGFQKVMEYGELLCFFDPAVQYAVNGNFADNSGLHGEAVSWYARALKEKDAPLWAYMRHAMALTSLGRIEEAFGTLETGIRKGFNNWGWLRAEPRLEPMRAEERWKQLI